MFVCVHDDLRLYQCDVEASEVCLTENDKLKYVLGTADQATIRCSVCGQYHWSAHDIRFDYESISFFGCDIPTLKARSLADAKRLPGFKSVHSLDKIFEEMKCR